MTLAHRGNSRALIACRIGTMTGESNQIPGVVEMKRPIEEFVGSVSFEVVRKAHCPVTMVH